MAKLRLQKIIADGEQNKVLNKQNIDNLFDRDIKDVKGYLG